MGQIVLSGEEMVSILAANTRLPEQVMGIETEGEEIKVHVATPVPLLRSIPVRVRFAGFEQRARRAATGHQSLDRQVRLAGE